MNPFITISTHRGKQHVPAENILRMQSTGAYTVFYEKNGDQHVLSTNIGQVLRRLNSNTQLKELFFRVHRSHAVNLQEVLRYQCARGGNVVLSDNAVIAVAQRRKSKLLKILKQLK
jgi:two-component system LytT family response regulator